MEWGKRLFWKSAENMKNTKLHIKTFQQLTVDELYELLRVRSEVFVVEQDYARRHPAYQDEVGEGVLNILI